jgi:quercetin dioxygenase-like cupin family protein
MLGTIDYPGDGRVSILMTVELAPNAVIARHTHPGVESSVVMEGEVMLEGEGQPARTGKAGEGFQVPPCVPHGGRKGLATSKITATYIVEKDKPLASPA